MTRMVTWTHINVTQCIFFHIFYPWSATEPRLHYSCSSYQLMHFSPHNYVFGRTEFKPPDILKDKYKHLIKLQAVTIEKIRSPEVCYKFLFRTIFRSLSLLPALAKLQLFWEQLWLSSSHISNSWGKRELKKQQRVWCLVGSQYPLIFHR
jgi:hypothetical protein